MASTNPSSGVSALLVVATNAGFGVVVVVVVVVVARVVFDAVFPASSSPTSRRTRLAGTGGFEFSSSFGYHVSLGVSRDVDASGTFLLNRFLISITL